NKSMYDFQGNWKRRHGSGSMIGEYLLFQELEEERIEFIKKISWDYSNFIAAACLKDDESCERIRTALQTIKVEKEIQSFIEERGTGYDPDYEMDGRKGETVFKISNPAMFIKKAFQRPHSFASSSSLFGSSSSGKNKASSKRNSSVISSKASHEEFSQPSSNSLHEQDNSSIGLEGESKVSLTSLYDEVEAESNRIIGHTISTSPKNVSRSSVNLPQQAPTARPLFFVRVVYDYLREMELEMSISAGQVVAVLATHDDGWWEGEYVDPTTGHSTRGIFPSNFTRRIE
ncbi:formin-binding protein, partial [Massospora cicadina]